MAALAALMLTSGGAALAASATVKVGDVNGQAVAGAVVVFTPVGASTATKPLSDVSIVQRDMRFEPAVTVVTPGTKVRFNNLDNFDHHVKGERGQQFSYRLKGLGRAPTAKPDTIEIVIEGGKGPVTLGCLLHSRMAASIYVADSPWYGVSKADGSVTVDGLPEGSYAMSVWHPRSLVEQSAVPVQLGAGHTPLQAQIR